jgi:hypothetical protein
MYSFGVTDFNGSVYSTCSICLTLDPSKLRFNLCFLFMIVSTGSSHKKLLVNVEKTVGVQLNDAENKVAGVQKVGQQFLKLTRSYLSSAHLFVKLFCRERGRG